MLTPPTSAGLAKMYPFVMLLLPQALALLLVSGMQANEGDETLLPAVPHQLAQQKDSDFCFFVQMYRERLQAAGWSATNIDMMEQEHQELSRAVVVERDLHAALAACKEDVPFAEAWSVLKDRFGSLNRFVDDIASIFRDSAQIESDLSIIKPERDALSRGRVSLHCWPHVAL